MAIRTIRGLQKVSFDFWTTTGPRHIQAGVTIDYSPAAEFVFVAHAIWPEDANYSAAVQEEVRREISLHCAAAFGGRFVLEAIRFHDRGSSERAFRTAAREAVRSLFSMSEIVDYEPPPIPLKRA